MLPPGHDVEQWALPLNAVRRLGVAGDVLARWVAGSTRALAVRTALIRQRRIAGGITARVPEPLVDLVVHPEQADLRVEHDARPRQPTQLPRMFFIRRQYWVGEAAWRMQYVWHACGEHVFVEPVVEQVVVHQQLGLVHPDRAIFKARWLYFDRH